MHKGTAQRLAKGGDEPPVLRRGTIVDTYNKVMKVKTFYDLPSIWRKSPKNKKRKK